MATFMDIKGTSNPSFQLEKGGPKIFNNAGAFEFLDPTETLYVDITASVLNAAADAGLVLNSQAAGAGADWKMTLARPAAGMTAALTFVLPPDYGSASQVLTTDGAGNLTWNAPSVPSALQVDVTALAWNGPATVTMFTLPANAMVDSVSVIVDTTFDGTTPATVEIGIAGTQNKYMDTFENDLTSAPKDSWTASHNNIPVGITEALKAYFVAAVGGVPSAGAARIITRYVIPS